MKNFQNNLIEDKLFIANPYIYSTPEVQQQIQLGIMGKVSTLILGSTIANIVTAPLQTVITSLQLSVLPHKDIFVSVQSRTKQLSRLNTQLTIAQKRNLQLMLRSGGQFQPYTAPVYTGYQQAFRNISKQGWKAFFKGLSFRLVYTIPHFLCYGSVVKLISFNQTNKLSFSNFMLKFWSIITITDMSFHMLHILENRYILQNNIKQFKVFRNVFRVMGKLITRGQVFKGLGYHLINSLLQIPFKFPAYLMLMSTQRITSLVIGLYYFSQILIYPFNTAFKRYICQSAAIPGMIPVRYSGIGHALKVIAFQQKIKGLYRGFGLHHVNILAKLLVLQLVLQNVSIQDLGQF